MRSLPATALFARVLGIVLAAGALWLALVRPATGGVVALKTTHLTFSPAEVMVEAGDTGSSIYVSQTSLRK